jgi:hypothetical protein
MTNASASTARSTGWAKTFAVLALLASLSSLMTSCAARPQLFYTGQDYLVLKQGQTFVAPRDMVLATESLVQSKDSTIIELIGAVRKLQADLDLKP